MVLEAVRGQGRAPALATGARPARLADDRQLGTARSWPDVAEAHVWWMPADSAPADEATVASWLDDGEQARAECFRFKLDRARFVRRHAFVRRLLAAYLDIPPGAVTIHHTPLGRPVLDPSCGISFNVSQAGELTVVAVTRDRDVGVDIERVRPLDEALDIARAWFSAQDVAVLLAMPRARRSLAFLSLWTRK